MNSLDITLSLFASIPLAPSRIRISVVGRGFPQCPYKERYCRIIPRSHLLGYLRRAFSCVYHVRNNMGFFNCVRATNAKCGEDFIAVCEGHETLKLSVGGSPLTP